MAKKGKRAKKTEAPMPAVEGADAAVLGKGTKQCPKCGIFNAVDREECEVCRHSFADDSQSGEEFNGDNLEREMWRLNRDLMIAITERDMGEIDMVKTDIQKAVYKSDGRFIQDEEGYGKEVMGAARIGDPEAVVEVEVEEDPPEVSEEVAEAVTGEEPVPDFPTVLEFTREKETQNTARFKEIVEAGRAPVIGIIYVQKWWIQGAVKVTVTIAKEEA